MTAPHRRQDAHGASRATWVRRKQWRARIYVGGRNVHLGYYSSPEEARAAHAAAVTRYFGAKYLKSEARP